MVVEDLHERVWDARVVYVVCAVSAATAVKTPAVVDLTNSEHFSVGSAPGFGVCDLLAGVLRYFVSLSEGSGGEAAFAVY